MSRTIAILAGGTSTERDVALESAASVNKAIGNRADVTLFDVPKDLDAFLKRRTEFDCVMPIFHGRGGEDGTIQGFLETLGIPYIFSGVTAQALAIDKSRTNTIVAAAGVRVPASNVIGPNVTFRFFKPVVIKPVDGGSSIGVTIARSQQELDNSIQIARKTSSPVLVEEYIVGKEYSVAVIDVDGQTIALPVIGIESKHEFFDYESKYQKGLAIETCPADITLELAQRLQAAALKVHHVIGARHVTRSDFIVDAQQQIWFIEVNTIPGMSVLLPMPIRASGREFGEVLMGWVEEAISRQKSGR